MDGNSLFVRSDPKDIKEYSSCELQEIADWLGATYAEDEKRVKIIIEKIPERRIRLVVMRAIPNTLYVFVARPGFTDMPVILNGVNKFIFQKLEVEDGDRKEETRQVIFRNKQEAEVIVDDSGYIALSS